jgi:hypothetical protein
VTDVHVESARLDDGVPLMYRNLGERVLLAFDPRQISEDAAIAVLCIHLPQLIGNIRVHRSAPAPTPAPPQQSP